MNKRMREIQTEILTLTKEADVHLNGEIKDIDKANEILGKIDALQKEFKAQEKLDAANKAGVPATEEPTKAQEVDSVKALADAARMGFKMMNETTPADGGYTVPEDIMMRIHKYREERFSLRSLIDVESVSTLSGRRTYQTRAQHTGFEEVGEGGKIGKKNGPQFEIMDYKIKKYAGYLPVTNELLADSDAALANTIVEWLGEEAIATENSKILAALATKEATALTGIKDIKKAINVTLSAFRGSIQIITNSDGVQYLDTLEDKNGRPLLSPDPTKPMEMRLSIGARTIPVVEIPNNVLPSDEGNVVPFIIGDLKSFLTMFDRKQLTLTVSDIASIGDFNAFEQDMTLFRGIMRADFQTKDTQSIVRGQLTVPA